MTKNELYFKGLARMEAFCTQNDIPLPRVTSMAPEHRYYGVGSCAFYRKYMGIHIAVPRCAAPIGIGRAWSWPGYVIDRTPYGVLQHELGHHVDELFSTRPLKIKADLFSYRIYLKSLEPPLTKYLGTDQQAQTFYLEWFAEHFRLFVTNPDLSLSIAPKFYAELRERLDPQRTTIWEDRLRETGAPDRIIEQARKKILQVHKQAL